jgi:hypothetical protein
MIATIRARGTSDNVFKKEQTVPKKGTRLRALYDWFITNPHKRFVMGFLADHYCDRRASNCVHCDINRLVDFYGLDIINRVCVGIDHVRFKK